MATQLPLSDFHPVVRGWFERVYGRPTPPQTLGWEAISAGRHTLICAPTGSGKTLAAFLWAINHLVEQHLREPLPPGVRILYISPLKALNNDIARNLEMPLAGIAQEARVSGVGELHMRAAVRTGDTTQAERRSIVKKPPDILITTPESLYLMLTSRDARKIFTEVQYVIVDEIHALCTNKRGVHLSLSLERLQLLASQEFVRIGLSATQNPLELVAAFLGGERTPGIPREVNIVDAGGKKEMDLRVICPVPDFSLLPAEGAWPDILADVAAAVRAHRTTLIFVNNRRLAERVAAKLNEVLDTSARPAAVNLMAVPVRVGGPPRTPPPAPRADQFPPVLAYHGSMSREARQEMEADLKAGRLRVVVATSALELGIDIGSIDLVIQLQSPKGAARGLQRVGRSGHLVAATSQGRLYATHREDLVECAVVAREMIEQRVEAVHIPELCLDVLAQQITAMVAVEEWEVDALFDVLRRSFNYRRLSRELYTGILQMLAGRYSNEMFRELRPRISWDKVNNTLRALPGTSHLAIVGGGTITDKGAYGVYLEGAKKRIGEVDEEFVFETRVGDTFLLGTQVWRVAEIDANRVMVNPAPGEPARMPFWRGEGLGRTFELASRIGAFRREIFDRLDDPTTLSWLKSSYPLDAAGAWNILEYMRRQRDVTGVIPHDGLVLMEGFRDEIGDPRLAVHAPFGRRVNGLLGLVLARRMSELTGVEPQMLYNDNAVLLRSPGADEIPMALLDEECLRRAEEIALNDVLLSPVFGGQFRQNASRALLLPRRYPGKRTPLWLQRLHAKDLLQVVRQYADFPMVIETIREVLNDILDFEHFRTVIRRLQSGEIDVRTVRTEVPSPFAASLLFEFIAVYMYEWDQPRENRAAQFAAVNRELLVGIISEDDMAALLRPEAIATVEQQLQHTAEGRRARSPEELMELLIRLGDLNPAEITMRVEGDAAPMLDTLVKDGRVVEMTIAGEPRWVAGEEQSLYKALHEPGNARTLLLRHLLTRPPTPAEGIAARFGMDVHQVRALLQEMSVEHHLVEGRYVIAEELPQWTTRSFLEKAHRQSVVLLRKEIQPCPFPQFVRYLAAWQNVGGRLRGVEGVMEVLRVHEGLALPADVWLRDLLPARVRDFTHEALASATAAADMLWVGAGNGRLFPVTRADGPAFLPAMEKSTDPPLSASGQHVLDTLRNNGASFLSELRGETGLSLAALNNALAELFWCGEITNDHFAEIMALKKSGRVGAEYPTEPVRLIRAPRSPSDRRVISGVRKAIRETPGWRGRWSLVRRGGVAKHIAPEERIQRQAEQLLIRYGIVSREFHRREHLLPWPLLAGAFQKMELRGEVRRGYFVEGLSGMQFASHEAVAALRQTREQVNDAFMLLHALDPANPFGPDLPLIVNGEHAERFNRNSSTYIGIHHGLPVALVGGHGAQIWLLSGEKNGVLELTINALQESLQRRADPTRRAHLAVETVDGVRAATDPWLGIFRQHGFIREMNQSMRWEP
jgi:ATP-dependent helicase Lhr and Lhr-like helicase